jgi:hypothetical protein
MKNVAFYGEVARVLGISSPWHEDDLGEYLGELNDEERAEGRPLLSSIVVHRGHPYLPGNGYFNLLIKWGLMNPTEDRKQVHERYRKDVWDYWSKH